jgi:hypothetical protein
LVDWNPDDVDAANGVNAMAHMNSRRDEAHDTVVIDPAELEPTSTASPRALAGELMVPLARGTREQVVARAPAAEVTERQLPRIPEPPRRDRDDRRERVALERRSREERDDRQERGALERRSREDQDDRQERGALERRSREDQDDRRERGALERRSREDQDDRQERGALERRSREDQDDRRERGALERRSREDQDDRRERGALERDPVAVFRAWPHSTGGTAAPPPRTLEARPSPRGRRIQDKIVLAHLALDLFQEIDQMQAIVQRAHDGSSCDPDSGTCADPRCAATIDVLRGALVEACLLVQRVAMMPPDERLDIEDRIHDLLELLHHTRGE